ncbi:MAG TPA: four helix bundle protein [Pyrinomonadaceae bacterium]|jgi:four helix bundle protein
MREGIERFEDLIAWQKARFLTAQIYKVTGEGDFAKDFGLKNQIQRAAVSIMSNIAEGFERARPAEFHQFLSMAKASCAELRSQLYVAFDVGYLFEEEFNELMTLAQEVSRIIGGLRAAVGRNRDSQKKSSSTQHSVLST